MDKAYKAFGDDFNRYVKSIRAIPLLSLEEEKNLSEIIMENKDKAKVHEAVNKIISSNLRLVVKLAIKYYRTVSSGNIRLSIMDLISEGNLGLLYAAKKFDYKKGKFSNYSLHWIKRHLIRARLKSALVQIPINHVNVIQSIINIEKSKGKLEEDDFKDIAQKNDCSVELVHIIMQTNKNRFFSLDSICDNDDDSHKATYSDILSSSPDSHEKDYDNQEMHTYLLKKMNELKPMEREIIQHRFFDKEGNLTCLQIATKMGISKQRVHKVLGLALKKLGKKIKENTCK